MINYIVVGRERSVTLAVLQAVRSFTDAGCMVIGTRANRGLRWSSLCQRLVTMRFDGADDDRVVALVNDLARHTRHMTLIAADSAAIRMVNRVAGRLPVAIAPIPDTPTLTMLDDRWRFLRLCRQHQLPVPVTRLIGGEAEPEFPALAAELGLPFIVKPIDRRHPASVVVRCRRDLWRLPARGLLLAQRIAPGVEVGMQLLADRGQLGALALTGLNAEQAERFRPELERLAARLCHVSAFNGAMRLRARIDAVGAITLIDCIPHFCTDLTAAILSGLNLVAESVQPAPRHDGPHRILQSDLSVGHPLAPGRWRRLSAADEGGRLLRAMSLDLYSLSLATGSLLRSAYRSVASRRPMKTLPATPALNRRQNATAGQAATGS